ncbi:MAG: gliding motility-associated ABC transporter substrate-binding protein GldG [Cyclobacteriaceae bacterium]|nr:gliding motility-associated ABC transporter substrate-binding protein GldG [Cyclobacteriaceae bacterium]
MGDWLLLANAILLAVVLNQLAALYFFRLDLTEEKRFTIKAPTKELLAQLPEDVFVEVFLAGDLNPGFTRFQKAIAETLEEFRIYSRNRVKFVFTDPAQARSEQDRQEYFRYLAAKGVLPLPVFETKNGQRVEKIVFPGALISYAGQERGVMLFKANRSERPQEVLNQAIEGIEFELANAIQLLSADQVPTVGWVTGHDELDTLRSAGFRRALAEKYLVQDVSLARPGQLQAPAVLIVAKPRTAFSEGEKYHLDQFLMKGGRALFLLDRLEASMDSASREDYFAFPYELNLDDQLFRYGVRINPDLVQDRMAAPYPIVTSAVGGKPQITPMEWPFFPLVNVYANHPATRNMDAVVLRFASTVDTIRAAGVKKTPLLFTSPYARTLGAPVKVSVNDLRQAVQAEVFNQGPLPVGYLLEGTFTSLYKNRFAPKNVDPAGFREASVPTRMIVVADGDIARNEVNWRQGRAQPLGYDPVSEYTFANKDLLMNLVAYLVDAKGVINARTKEIKIRPLDKERINTERTYWQFLNLLLPWLLLVGVGVALAFWRKQNYSKF